MVLEQQSVSDLSAEQLRALATRLLTDVRHKQAVIDKLTHENALLKRLKFAAQSERYSAEQRSLLDETLDADLQAVSDEISQNASPAATPPEKQQPKRQPLPAHLPRREIRHEPESTTCGCGCQMRRIGEDVAEKLDYEPGVFTVERHIRGKWACAKCETLVQAPVDAHVIDKGIPTSGLLAQVLIAKFADHLPLYRQEAIFARAGLGIGAVGGFLRGAVAATGGCAER
jgi:transposase